MKEEGWEINLLYCVLRILHWGEKDFNRRAKVVKDSKLISKPVLGSFFLIIDSEPSNEGEKDFVKDDRFGKHKENVSRNY